jgi:stage II sporulation protein D
VGEPELRIGLLVGASTVRVSGDQEIMVLGPNAAVVPKAPSSRDWTLLPDKETVVLAAPSGWRSPSFTEVTLAPTSPGTALIVNERAYRGRVSVVRDRTGLTVVNRVGLESYLAGVVSAEMGRRDSTDTEALAAQAVISRTFAIRNVGKRRLEGFDLYATVVDQVYGGVTAESALSWRAVRETTGQILTHHGSPIDAFFFSTCGGRTADGTEVFSGAERDYLRSVRDEDANGQAYCSLSPRFRWREEWSGEELRAILLRTLPPVLNGAVPNLEKLRSVRVVQRTASDRVSRIAIDVGDREITVEGPAIRQVLRPTMEQPLRSSNFTLRSDASSKGLVRLVAEGTGAGHGVGFCQWGAVGRARAGQGFAQILAAYFQETDLERIY